MIFMMIMLIILLKLKSILDGVKNVYKNRKIISVFEPHRYSRVISLKKNLQNLLKNQI